MNERYQRVTCVMARTESLVGNRGSERIASQMTFVVGDTLMSRAPIDASRARARCSRCACMNANNVLLRSSSSATGMRARVARAQRVGTRHIETLQRAAGVQRTSSAVGVAAVARNGKSPRLTLGAAFTSQL
jgi:hypothetical protein